MKFLKMLMVAMVTIAVALPAAADVVYVGDPSFANNFDGAGPLFQSIDEAITVLAPEDGYDTVVLFPGTGGESYAERIRLDEGMTLISARRYLADAGIPQPVLTSPSGILVQGADSAVIEDIVLDGVLKERGHWGVNLAGVTNMSIIANTVRNCEYGFHLNSSRANRLEGNVSENNDVGFVVTSSLQELISNNISRDNAVYGYAISMSNGNTVTGNESRSNGRYGFWVVMAQRNRIEDNRSLENGEDGFYLNAASHNQVTNNDAARNGGYAFYLTGVIQGGSYTGNIIERSDGEPRGIYCDVAEGAFDFSNGYWGTVEDEDAMADAIQGPGKGAIVWQPVCPTDPRIMPVESNSAAGHDAAGEEPIAEDMP